MNRNIIKYIAISAMLIDHIAEFFIPEATLPWYIMRIIGRFTAPVMCYFLAEGFRYTSSTKKYGIRLFVFAVISQPAYAFVHGFSILTPKFNMIFTLFLCFLILLAYEKIENIFLKTTVIFLLVAVSVFSDWGIIAPLWVLSFYMVNSRKNILTFTAVSLLHVALCISNCVANGELWYSPLWQIGVLLFIPVLLVHKKNLKKQSNFSKWFFYIFYPLHLVLIGIADTIIN